MEGTTDTHESTARLGHGGLFNTGEAGTIVVTNFLLVFLSEESMEVNALGTIPLATIEKFNKIAFVFKFVLLFQSNPSLIQSSC
ncbi:phosphatidylinositol-3-phosphatase myotubularin-1 isoform X2 [Lactuca sativa]|uniref:phosphatidylinositol-3-phosphatase myotubularin-1 isoform X2 n=1 Tax=Lactuca sativa TaxID=4236 RepID=UPI000CBE6B0B|nr:phosphatidylinositol-3-phosphatase myotubularin-1 isoform X2 [Lactuca sativa]